MSYRYRNPFLFTGVPEIFALLACCTAEDMKKFHIGHMKCLSLNFNVK